MTNANATRPTPSLRLWPGVLAVGLALVARFGLPAVVPDAFPIGVLAGLLGGVAVLVWWPFFSRAPRHERWLGVLAIVGALAGARVVSDPSIATGMMGLLVPVYGAPLVSMGFVLAVAATRRAPSALRIGAFVAACVLAAAGFALIRTEGLTGGGGSTFAWRWTPTAEERLLAEAESIAPRGPVDDAPASEDRPDEAEPPALWPGFRGAGRDALVNGPAPGTDWESAPPVELWRRPVGPGWSSFAVGTELCYTQEQRGEEEVVACYRLATGEPVWRHADPVRFWESNAGAGPRATPTLVGGRLFTLGATGILNVLDPEDGHLLWSRDALADTGASVPEWGISGSPLVLDDTVWVAVDGALGAYDVATGEPRCVASAGRESYSSPHALSIDGDRQVVLMTNAGATAYDPADGSVLWEHAWPGSTIVQPARLADGDLLISTGATDGLRRITVARGPDGWSVAERWTSTRLKPYFNDFVVVGEHAYGLDRGILTCVDVAGGDRAWKGGRYGCGQLLGLVDAGLLLVLSEEGEIALVAADPDEHRELARAPAIEGKTWNHPVLVGDVLLVRNDREMAAFRLARVDG